MGGANVSERSTTAHDGGERLDPAALHDVPVRFAVELGRTRMLAADAAGLEPGAVIDLDDPVEAPVTAYVEGRPVARGALVVVEGEWALRIDAIVERPSNTAEPSTGGAD